VVGNAGAGKTRLARRLAGALGVPLVELDALHHLPGWEPIDPGQFMDVVSELAAAEAWVIDGNYRFGSWSATVRSGSGPTPSCGSILPGGS